MGTLNYFLKQAIKSSRKGKFYKRPWINLFRICALKVNEIRELYKKGDTSFRKLGKLFNVANCTIESIIKNKTWKILIND